MFGVELSGSADAKSKVWYSNTGTHIQLFGNLSRGVVTDSSEWNTGFWQEADDISYP
jgi:hypothetical protein